MLYPGLVAPASRQMSANIQRCSERAVLRASANYDHRRAWHDYQLAQRLDRSFDCHPDSDQQALDALVYHKPDTA
jgi:hypothetical protein